MTMRACNQIATVGLLLVLCLTPTWTHAAGGDVLSETPAYFRWQAPGASQFLATGTAGSVTWANAAPHGATGIFCRATSLQETNWADYVQCNVTGPVMTARLFDPSPPTGMQFIPGGLNAGEDIDAGAYVLKVAAFYMDRGHVTRALWNEIRRWAVTNAYTDLGEGNAQRDDHPVYDVTWFEAVKWCNARSEREGLKPAYRVGEAVFRTGVTDEVVCELEASGYRLPTLVEWEFAARGGLRGRRYPWGDEIDLSLANHDGFFDRTTVAGTYPPNGYGLYDMAGNLWQWVWDWHPDHVGSRRAIRGGSWSDGPPACRCTLGNYYLRPVACDYLLGFRAMRPAL